MAQQLLIWSHIIPGFLSLVIGLLIFIFRKSGRTHVILGWIYASAIFWVCLSAFLHIAFFRFSFFLSVIGVITFNSTYSGIRIMRKRNSGKTKWYDWLVALLTTIFGFGLVAYGIYKTVDHGNYILGLLSLIFGLLSIFRGLGDIKQFISPLPKSDQWWLHHHISAMGGSYIAAVTAFAVQFGNIYLDHLAWSWILWVLPAIVISPILSKYRSKLARLGF